MDPSQLRWALAAALALVAYLAWRHVALRLRVGEQIETRLGEWRERELLALQRRLEQAAEVRARALYEQWRARSEGDIRKDAASRSRSVVTGKVLEHLAPWLEGFPYNPREARFLGAPVDFVVFAGLEQGGVREVVFVEVKTGSATLSARERGVRDAIAAGRVRFEEFRAATPEAATRPPARAAQR